MLTNQDLEAIGNLLDERLDYRFDLYDKRMDVKFKRELHPMNKQIKIMKEHFKTINEHLKKIDRTLEAYFRFFKFHSGRIDNLEFRLKKIETNPQLN